MARHTASTQGNRACIFSWHINYHNHISNRYHLKYSINRINIANRYNPSNERYE